MQDYAAILHYTDYNCTTSAPLAAACTLEVQPRHCPVQPASQAACSRTSHGEAQQPSTAAKVIKTTGSNSASQITTCLTIFSTSRSIVPHPYRVRQHQAIAELSLKHTIQAGPSTLTQSGMHQPSGQANGFSVSREHYTQQAEHCNHLQQPQTTCTRRHHHKETDRKKNEGYSVQRT
jgi:hypothetical protein